MDLLKERFGQQYKLVDAHQEALLNVPAPSNNLTSLQSFYDTIQSHMRALDTLGTTPDSLLTRVILGKLPPEVKTQMARDRYDSEWNIEDLMASILKEIRIFEAGQQPGRRTNSVSTTTSFHMGANRGSARDNQRKDPNCVFCKGMHKPNSCTTVSCPKQHLAAVKSAGLCFNCLARHKVSQCPSKFTCRECHKRHHTSLCHAFTTATMPSTQPVSGVTTSPDQGTTPTPITTPTTAQTINAVTQNEGTPTSIAATSLSATSTRMCLLKTAIANVSAGQTTMEGHILFDEGAQRSFITQELANQLQIHPISHEQISVSSFGEQVSATKRLAVASISIETINKGHIPISVLIVPKLTAPIQNSSGSTPLPKGIATCSSSNQ